MFPRIERFFLSVLFVFVPIASGQIKSSPPAPGDHPVYTQAQAQSTVPQLESLPSGDDVGLWSADLPRGDMDFLKQLTRGIVAACVENSQTKEPHTAAEIFAEIRVQQIALSPSRPSGLVAQGSGTCMCDANGNCPLWIIDHQPQPTVVLKARSIQSFARMKSLVADYFDLVLGTRGPEKGTTKLQTFHFDGKRYQRNGCAVLAWAEPYGTLLIPPRITPGGCPVFAETKPML